MLTASAKQSQNVNCQLLTNIFVYFAALSSFSNQECLEVEKHLPDAVVGLEMLKLFVPDRCASYGSALENTKEST